MEITEVRVKLIHNQADKLRGFATITIGDSIVVRDLKIIDGAHGLFLAMPSRKLCDRCGKCGGKNNLRARYCNDCGVRLKEMRGETDERGRPRLYADIAHPINQPSRDLVQTVVIQAYHEELARSKQEGYVAVRFDDLDYEAYDA
jgi:stage V sporulation protein G